MKIIKEGDLKKLNVLNVKNVVVFLKQKKMNINGAANIMKNIIIALVLVVIIEHTQMEMENE